MHANVNLQENQVDNQSIDYNDTSLIHTIWDTVCHANLGSEFQLSISPHSKYFKFIFSPSWFPISVVHCKTPADRDSGGGGIGRGSKWVNDV